MAGIGPDLHSNIQTRINRMQEVRGMNREIGKMGVWETMVVGIVTKAEIGMVIGTVAEEYRSTMPGSNQKGNMLTMIHAVEDKHGQSPGLRKEIATKKRILMANLGLSETRKAIGISILLTGGRTMV